ncbi:hypothetical protein D3C87_1008970 [compost metagenome]
MEHVGHLDKLREGDALLLQLQGGAHQPGQGLGEPGLLAEIARHLHVLVKPQHQIDLAARQLRLRQGVAQYADLYGDPGGQLPEALDEGRDQHALHVIRGAEHEAALRLARLELFLLGELLLQQAQHLLHPQMQPLGPGRRQHPLGRAHQQRIVKEGPQAIEGVAHGGLADKERLGGAGHAALRHQGVKGEQQIEVELVQFHGGIIRRVYGTIHPIHLMDGHATSYTATHSYFSRVPRSMWGPQSMQGALR